MGGPISISKVHPSGHIACCARAVHEVVQDHTHGLGGCNHALPSHMREWLCEAHSKGQ